MRNGSVDVVCEGEKGSIEQLIGEMAESPPSFANIEGVSVEYADYIGKFDSFERMDEDIPEGATLGNLLSVMKRFNTKAETLVMVLSDMNSTVKSVKADTSLMLDKQDSMLDKQDSMLDKQDSMLEKQDTTIQILRSVKEDTSQIKDIKADTGIMKDKLTSLEEIHRDVLDLREKYDQLSDDVAGIKIMISGREAGCVFD